MMRRADPLLIGLTLAIGVSLSACTAQLERSAASPADPSSPTDPKAPGDPNAPKDPNDPVSPVRPVDPLKPVTCDPSAQRLGATRAWRLTPAQLDQVAQSLLGRPTSFAQQLGLGAGSPQGFVNVADALLVQDLEARSIEAAARQLAAQVAAERLGELFPCTTDRFGDETCARGFIEAVGLLAWRRPMTSSEVDQYARLYKLAYDGLGQGDQGVRVVVEALAQSAPFIYRVELGDGAPDASGQVRLHPYEIAQALAFTLWGAPPDAALLAMAAQGRLDQDEGVAQVAAQMMDDPRARQGVPELYLQLFGLRALPNAEKNPERFPQYEALRPAMIEQASAFLARLIFEEQGDFQALMTSSAHPVNAAVAPLYGVDEASAAWVWRQVPGRAGVLTLPGVLSAFSSTEDASIAKRGVMVRERVLCEHLNDPPPGAFDDLPPHEPGLSEREFFELTTEQGSCAGCHALINGPGYALDGFDAMGAPRQWRDGSPWRTQGRLVGSRDADGPLEGPVDLAARLGQSAQARQCLASQHLRYALGRQVSDADACSLASMMERWERGQWSLRELMVATVTSRAFLYRAAP